MKELEVNCITRSIRAGASNEHITHIGNSTNRWRLLREIAIERIEGETEAYYTLDEKTGARVFLDVVREAGKEAYLRTRADGKWNDNLLALGECGVMCRLVE